MFGALRFGFGGLPSRNVRAHASSDAGMSGMSPMPADAKTALIVGLTLAVVPPAVGYPAAKGRFAAQEAEWKRTHPAAAAKGKGKATEVKAAPAPVAVASETVKAVEEVKAPAPTPAAAVASVAPVTAASADKKKVAAKKETKVEDDTKWVKPAMYTGAAGAAVGAAMLVALVMYEKNNSGGKGNKPAASGAKTAPKPAPAAGSRA